MFQRFLGILFIVLSLTAVIQCAKRGNPTGGPEDIDAPILVRADPPNLTTEFKAKRIRLYFDEYIKLEDIQNQLIVSPPLKYAPEISPQGGARKYVEIILKDTLAENTTYTLNFGQSIVDNNEGNPSPFLNYVFSTGTYIDSLTVSGSVKDAFKIKPDPFISVMLYRKDSTFNDSTIYKIPPDYITNTLDSLTTFKLNHIKAGEYALIALKDVNKNNIFDQSSEKIAFIEDTVTLPTDSTYLLTLFKEIPNYQALPPSFAAANKIIFGYAGGDENIQIDPLISFPDSVRTLIQKQRDKDSLNYWFTPFGADSLVFTVRNPSAVAIDTFSVKSRKLAADSLVIEPSHRGSIIFGETFKLSANIPIITLDTSKVRVVNKDTLDVPFTTQLDSIKNEVLLNFEKEPNQNYTLEVLPDAFMDFFNHTNDSLNYQLSTRSFTDYGNLRMNINGQFVYPIIVQLTDEQGEIRSEHYATQPGIIEFNNLQPANYLVRVILDANENGKWDTGNYLGKIQPEKVYFYSQVLEMRANWEFEQSFKIEQ